MARIAGIDLPKDKRIEIPPLNLAKELKILKLTGKLT